MRIDKRSLKSMVMSALFTLGAGYLLLCLAMYFFQEKLLFFPDGVMWMTPADAGLKYEETWLQCEDGTRIHGWFVPAPQARGCLLFFHGNAGNISGRLESIHIFHQLGLEVLIIDYRGYGKSEGVPSEEGLYRDGQAALDFLLAQKKVDPRRLIVFGRSLGAAVAANTGRNRPLAGLVLESGFASLPEVGQNAYPFLPVRLLSKYRFPTARWVQEFQGPVMVLHSPDDEIIPFNQGEKIWAAAGEPKRFITLKGGHNEGFLAMGDDYVKAWQSFLDDCLVHAGVDPHP